MRRTFVGTYGGLSYLAPFFGVPSIAFHSDDRDLKSAHLEAIRAACAAIGGRFIELHVDDADLLGAPGIVSVEYLTVSATPGDNTIPRCRVRRQRRALHLN